MVCAVESVGLVARFEPLLFAAQASRDFYQQMEAVFGLEDLVRR